MKKIYPLILLLCLLCGCSLLDSGAQNDFSAGTAELRGIGSEYAEDGSLLRSVHQTKEGTVTIIYDAEGFVATQILETAESTSTWHYRKGILSSSTVFYTDGSHIDSVYDENGALLSSTEYPPRDLGIFAPGKPNKDD